MPEIKLQHVVSFSSEDKNYPAENLVKDGGFKKWKSATAGEKQVTVTLQFEKATKIDQIEIGNEGSAFIEVLVGRSNQNSDDYQVILVASSVATPIDSRNGQSLTSVRIFKVDSLSKAVVNEKWDRVKVVCTQPFNKTIQYGLSFIKLYSPPDENSSSDDVKIQHKSPPQRQRTLGAFLIKSNDVDDQIKVGSRFAMRHSDKAESTAATTSPAAAARDASRLADESRRSTNKDESATIEKKLSSVEKKTAGNKPSSSNTSSDKLEPPKTSISKAGKKPEEAELAKVEQLSLKRQSTDVGSASSRVSRDREDDSPALKRTRSESAKYGQRSDFSSLMKRTVFVLSGFQNPLRGKLRDKALEMGAQYKPDWTKACTHLICAYDNTPKYNQVEGKGKIVKKEWILDSYDKKKLMPWREYRLGRAKTPPGDSDESDNDVTVSSPEKGRKAMNKNAAGSSAEASLNSKAATTHDKGSKSHAKGKGVNKYENSDDSGEDTEEEVRRIKATKAKSEEDSKGGKREVQGAEKLPAEPHGGAKTRGTGVKDGSDHDERYDMSTDEDDVTSVKAGECKPKSDKSKSDSLEELPEFFADKHFFFYGDLSITEQRKLLRLITAYNGVVDDYMNDKVTYVITKSQWNEDFDNAMNDNGHVAFVRPAWIYACNSQEQLVPHHKYIVSSS